MVKLEDIEEKLNKYSKTYRRDDLPELKISGLYSLFPDKNPNITADVNWPNSYINGDKAGVYIILNQDMQVLYIGKASMSNTIGGRLNSYFAYEDDKKTCKVKSQNWKGEPCFIATVAVDDSMTFEAPALEEYLIKNFSSSLIDNTIGTNRTGE